MLDFSDFAGCFGDFETMYLDSGLENYVIRFFEEAGDYASYKIIIGYTPLPNDILLHLVDVEGCETYDEAEKNLKDYGIEFMPLSRLIQYECHIYPSDQLTD